MSAPRRRIVELCCGSSAVSLHLLGAAPLMPYQGSKKRYAEAITRTCGLTRPDAAILVDLSPWPEALTCLACSWMREAITSRLSSMRSADPMVLWERFTAESVPVDRVERVSRFLALQRWSFRGKPVWSRGRGMPGASKTDMYGRKGTDKFGEVKPQLIGLIGRVRSFPTLPLVAQTRDAREVAPKEWVIPGSTVVYFDPPYAGTTGYLDADLGRSEVLDIARRWQAAGAQVVISEASPLPLDGWQHVNITHMRKGRRSAWQTAEWLTVSPDVPLSVALPAQLPLFREAA